MLKKQVIYSVLLNGNNNNSNNNNVAVDKRKTLPKSFGER